MFGNAGLSILESGSLLAQSGFAKTMLGYVAVGVLIVIGLALVLRPTHRISPDKKKK